MFKNLRLKLATRRLERAKVRASRPRAQASNRDAWYVRLYRAILSPIKAVARFIASLANRIWRWLRQIDLIAMVNLTLLVAIIVLFSMLIMDILRSTRGPVIVVDNPVPVQVVNRRPQVSVTNAAAPQSVRARPSVTSTTPGNKTNACVSAAVIAQPVQTVVPKPVQMARQYDLFGDIVIDTHYAQSPLTPGVRVLGNVYLQNMRRYTLPCGTRIDGNLFLRNVGQLTFCGDFVVTGNIYVNRNSSFGPIPRTAHLGGQVVL